MTTMSEYAALHGWEVGAQLRYKDSATPSTITAITHSEVRISTPGDFPGRLTFGPDIDHWKLVMDSVPVSLRARMSWPCADCSRWSRSVIRLEVPRLDGGDDD